MKGVCMLNMLICKGVIEEFETQTKCLVNLLFLLRTSMARVDFEN